MSAEKLLHVWSLGPDGKRHDGALCGKKGAAEPAIEWTELRRRIYTHSRKRVEETICFECFRLAWGQGRNG